MLRVALEIDRQVLVEVKVRAGSDGEFRGRRAANECCLCRSVSHPWDASHVTFQWAARSNGTGTGEGYCAARRRVAKIRSLLVWSILLKISTFVSSSLLQCHEFTYVSHGARRAGDSVTSCLALQTLSWGDTLMCVLNSWDLHFTPPLHTVLKTSRTMRRVGY